MQCSGSATWILLSMIVSSSILLTHGLQSPSNGTPVRVHGRAQFRTRPHVRASEATQAQRIPVASARLRGGRAVTQAASTVSESDPSYDHQKQTYSADIDPITVTDAPMSITPFFSPDHSIDTLTALVANANQTIDIGTPGWSSWIGCTNWASGKNDGCTVDKQRNEETFPIWAAVLNAAHRGVQVRILTNNYGQPPSQGLIDPLQFLNFQPNITVRYFNTVTFYHAKYIQVDGKRVSVSSVNFSKTSFMKNREAGVILEGSGAADLLAFLTKIYNIDWAQATPHQANQQYTPEQMKVILDPSFIPLNMPTPVDFPGAYKSPLTQVQTTTDALLFASPDQAHRKVWEGFDDAKESLDVFIYQITNSDFCNKLIAMRNGGIKVSVFVSRNIFDAQDWMNAQYCYQNLTNADIPVQVTADYMYSYSHQKFWILDDSSVFMSTGNWGQSDFPYLPPQDFPPYYNEQGQANAQWRKTNRDYTIRLTDPNVVGIFKQVRDQDYQRGSVWYPGVSPNPSGTNTTSGSPLPTPYYL